MFRFPMFVIQVVTVPWCIFGQSSSKKSNKIFYRHFVASIVDLNIVAINVDVFILKRKVKFYLIDDLTIWKPDTWIPDSMGVRLVF